jgi:hypothetical protein
MVMFELLTAEYEVATLILFLGKNVVNRTFTQTFYQWN